jgi:hypothetical protein
VLLLSLLSLREEDNDELGFEEEEEEEEDGFGFVSLTNPVANAALLFVLVGKIFEASIPS